MVPWMRILKRLGVEQGFVSAWLRLSFGMAIPLVAARRKVAFAGSAGSCAAGGVAEPMPEYRNRSFEAQA